MAYLLALVPPATYLSAAHKKIEKITGFG